MWIFTPLVVLLLGGLAPSGEALAQESIHGCVDARSGRVRVVAVQGQCTSRETPIEFAGEGPPGPPGPTGPPGPPGVPPPPSTGGAPAPEEDPPQFQLVGFTSETFTGAQGVLAFTRACQEEFEESRMCTSAEVMSTVAVPEDLEGTAWVRPVFVDGTHDISGVEDTGAERFTCKGWIFEGYEGLSVTAAGRFNTLGCMNLFHVACCAETSAEAP